MRTFTYAPCYSAALGTCTHAYACMRVRSLLYSAALGACRRGGQADQAIELIRKAHDDPAVAPNGIMYTLAMAACNAAGQWEEALNLFKQRTTSQVEPQSLAQSLAPQSVAQSACSLLRAGKYSLTDLLTH